MSQFRELDHLKISLEDIKLATNDFSDGNFIGQGGFGKVYKGHLPASSGSSGTSIAVKRLGGQGQGHNEFLREVVMLASYKHDNLASLVGYCEEGEEHIIVYKHEARGSLDGHLATDLTWVQRLQICLDAARGLSYLHSDAGDGHRVLHRDIKSSNVLLNENWEAKISDLGLCKIGPTNTQFTFLVTDAAGTYGYVDPAYLTSGILTKESDVYSFGVLLFEVLCGRQAVILEYNNERRFLSHLAKLRYEEGRVDEIIFPGIRNQIMPISLQTYSTLAYQCLKTDRRERPSMASVIQQLQISLQFQNGCRRFTELWGSRTGGSPWSLQLDSNQKLMKITIDHEDWIYSIGFTVEDSSDLSRFSQHHGGAGGRSGGEISEVIFEADEEITRIDGTIGITTGTYAYYTVISSLCFMTNKKRHGPFGKEEGTSFSSECDVGSLAGFYGRAGFYLDGFGCYLKATI